MKRTKIVCTIGPASETNAKLTKMVKAGLNVARLNFSHGTYRHHAMLVRNVRAVSRTLHTPLAILQDLQGPRIRTGELPAEGIKIKTGQEVVLVPPGHREQSGDRVRIPIQYAGLYRDVKVGHSILIEDGTIQLKVLRIQKPLIVCRVIAGSLVKAHKGMNFPQSTISTPAITDKDKQDLAFGVRQGVDFIALSFVKDANDINRLRAMITALEKRTRRSPSPIKIIAKIERPQAVKNFENILRAADGIMIARGDLGLEIPIENLPLIQKHIIRRCQQEAKPVIVATQMLDSMIRNPVPTRAEVSDVANAILDGTDAIMLSGETATGTYPLQAVQVMQKIANQMESTEIAEQEKLEEQLKKTDGVADGVAFAAQDLAEQLGAKIIVCATFSGFTGRAIAKFRPEVPLIALAVSERVRNQLCVSWGVQSALIPRSQTFADLLSNIRKFLVIHRLAKTGECAVVAAGYPFGKQIATNTLYVLEV